MRRANANISVDKYLSIKRIVLLSVAITVAYYFLYTLNHYFGRPTFDSHETDQDVDEEANETEAIEFKDAQAMARERQSEFNEPPEKYRKNFYKKVLFNIPLTFIMVFAVMMYCKRLFARHFKRRSDELAAIIVGALVITFVLSSMCTLLQLKVFPDRPGPTRTTFQYVMRGYLGDCSLMAMAIMVVYLVRAQFHEKVADVENEKLRAENMASRYEALENQMDPHFLFNSLNTLKSLIDIDAEKAGDFVQQLSTVLRSTLQNKEVVTLAEELDCVRSYCKMMKMRYGDNLIFVHHIDHERYDGFYVLPLSIQGLIENAIKHNVISTKQPLTVNIVTDNDNHLIISNKIQHKIGKEEGTGIGLANLSERYRIKWNENVEIFDDGTIFSVTLPLKQND